MAKLTATHLQSQHVRDLVVSSRTMRSAAALAARVGGRAIPWDHIGRALEASDIVVTATGATDPILTRDRVQAVMRSRRNRPLFIIDIAVPRDVEPGAGELEEVFLYNIDDLQSIVSESVARRTQQIEHADTIVSAEVERFVVWLRSRHAVPTVVALRQHFEDVRRSELKRLEPKLGGLGPEARARVEDVTRLFVEKLLIAPTEQLKSAPDQRTIDDWADALTRLFSLSAGDLDEKERG
jgi:glutamyl-tRNA reductase